MRAAKYRLSRKLSTRYLCALIFFWTVILGLAAYIIIASTEAVHRVDSPYSGEMSRQTNTIYLTVPEMKRVHNLEVKTGGMQNEKLLHDSALHVRGTGYPWLPGSNVYIAGHRLGFPGTDSYLVFADINTLEKGDDIILRDDAGNTWRYEVTQEKVVGPYNHSVVDKVPGKNLVTLQSCTYPLYQRRILVIGEQV